MSQGFNEFLPSPLDTPVPPPTTTSNDGTTPEAPGAVLNLDEEVANVLAGLGSFWGKVRKSGATALQTANTQLDTARTQLSTARQDLTPLLTKARADLDQFGGLAKAELARLSTASTGNDVMIGSDGTVIMMPEEVGTGEVQTEEKIDVKGKGVDRSEQEGDPSVASSGTEDTATPPVAQAAAFFSRLQSQISHNPNFLELSKNLTNLQSSVSTNLSHLPTSLQTNLTQLQTQLASIDLKDLKESTRLADEYITRGETWIQELGLEVTKEVTRIAKDAVRVVPPTDGDGKLTKREQRLRKEERVAMGRKEGLLMRLRKDSGIILSVDPAKPPAPIPTPPAEAATTTSPENLSNSTPSLSASTSSLVPSDTREAFSKFLQTIEDRGGLEGVSWNEQIVNELEGAGDEEEGGLRKSLKELVPGTMTMEAFWTRYFFRVSQIEEDEVRRKKVLEGVAKEDEDFSWDADEEEEVVPESTTVTPTLLVSTSTLNAASPSPSLSAPTLDSPTISNIEGARSPDATHSSPRASSDGTGSYDVVGAASGNPSEMGDSAAGKSEEKAEDDGEDSDWE